MTLRDFDSLTGPDSPISRAVFDFELNFGACHDSLRWIREHEGVTIRDICRQHPEWAHTLKCPLEVKERLAPVMLADPDPAVRLWVAGFISKLSPDSQGLLVQAMAHDEELAVRRRLALSIAWLAAKTRDQAALWLSETDDAEVHASLTAAFPRLKKETVEKIKKNRRHNH
jgi:hypothetical protein